MLRYKCTSIIRQRKEFWSVINVRKFFVAGVVRGLPTLRAPKLYRDKCWSEIPKIPMATGDSLPTHNARPMSKRVSPIEQSPLESAVQSRPSFGTMEREAPLSALPN